MFRVKLASNTNTTTLIIPHAESLKAWLAGRQRRKEGIIDAHSNVCICTNSIIHHTFPPHVHRHRPCTLFTLPSVYFTFSNPPHESEGVPYNTQMEKIYMLQFNLVCSLKGKLRTTRTLLRPTS